MTEEKDRLRKRLIHRRKELSEQQRKEAGAAAEELLCSLPVWKEAGQVFAYCDCSGEMPTGGILRRALKEGKVLALPKVAGPGKMDFFQVGDISELKPGAYGILEPEPLRPVFPDAGTILLLPGTAFDENGYRLGYGGGFYDRYTSRYPEGIRIGLGYSFQLLQTIPHEDWDIRADGLVTEDEVRFFAKRKGCKMPAIPV